MDGRSVDAQQMFTAATLMCVVWLSALALLAREAQLIEFTGYRTHLLNGSSSLAFLPRSAR